MWRFGEVVICDLAGLLIRERDDLRMSALAADHQITTSPNHKFMEQ